jgi:hypothetical protein
MAGIVPSAARALAEGGYARAAYTPDRVESHSLTLSSTGDIVPTGPLDILGRSACHRLTRGDPIVRNTPHKYQVGAAFAAVAALAAYGLAGTPAASAANSPFTSHRIKVDPDIRHVSNNTDAAQFSCQGRPIDGSQGIVCYDPSQIQKAYGVAPLLAQGKDGSGRTIANWLLTELLGALNKAGTSIAQSPMTPARLAELVQLVEAGTISGKIGKEVFEESFKTGESPAAIVERRGVQQISDEATLWSVVEKVVAASPKQTAEYQGGKDGLFGYFVGQVMKETEGRANPKLVNELLREKLKS